RAVLRPFGRIYLGLHRRRGRHSRAPAEAYRTAGHTFSRRSGANAARRAARGKAWTGNRAQDRRADHPTRVADAKRSARAIVRRNAKAFVVGTLGRNAE